MLKRKFDKEFKLNAVSLVKSQGLTISQVSRDLGVGLSTLQRWLREIDKLGANEAFPGEGHLGPEALKLRKLERENEVLRRERDILKKAVAIFSLP